MCDFDELITLLADLRSLVRQADSNGNKQDGTTTQSHYWHGVKVGYEDAADRLETLLQLNELPTTVSHLPPPSARNDH